MSIRPITHRGYQLMHEGVIALSQVESHGMRVDLKYLDNALKETKEQIRSLETELYKSEIWKTWRKRFGDKSNLTSDYQVGEVLFTVLKYPCKERTATGRPSTDVSNLERIKDPFVQGLIRLGKLEKAHGTYLKGIRREVVGDRIHPVFNLHTTVTYRSSSDTPNFQNMPVRDPFIAKLIRRIFIASPGCMIVENDFKGIEVSVAACYHKDPVMIDYIKDPTKDMHRDMAMQLYKLKQKDVHKNARYGAKNMFVFPEFYGSFYAQCAPSLWEWVDRAKIPGPDGKPLREHLDKLFPGGLGECDPDADGNYPDPESDTFAAHVADTESDFWGNRFQVYSEWKKAWFKQYLKNGYFDTLTGFRIEGVMKRNEVINYPVQGSAFHCLLWTLIRLNRMLKRYRMKSRVAGQIHDSIVGDVRVEELSDYLALVQEIVTKDLKTDYDWLNVPLVIENECCPPGFSWYEKEAFEFKDGIYAFTPKGVEYQTAYDRADRFLERLIQQFNQSKAA